jgi:ABC-type sugar transport system permease subunit
VIAAVRAWRREPLRVVLGGLAAVLIAASIAARTGRAADYFLPSLLANVGSALVWAASIAVGWPLLGVILGFLTGQRTRWRDDPDLVRAYARASWIWAASFLLRAGLLLPFYLTDQVLALGALKVVLGWPLVIGVIWASWLTIRATLPEGHPGLFSRATEPS